jgi:hypothetical protein
MSHAFVVSKLIVTEYTLIRQWWPQQLRDARYLDTGLTRTYFLDSNASPELIKLIISLDEEGKKYRFLTLRDMALDLPGVSLDDETHHL